MRRFQVCNDEFMLIMRIPVFCQGCDADDELLPHNPLKPIFHFVSHGLVGFICFDTAPASRTFEFVLCTVHELFETLRQHLQPVRLLMDALLEYIGLKK